MINKILVSLGVIKKINHKLAGIVHFLVSPDWPSYVWEKILTLIFTHIFKIHNCSQPTESKIRQNMITKQVLPVQSIHKIMKMLLT